MFFCLLCNLSSAQDFSDQWTGYFSYSNVKGLTEGNNTLYAAAENAVFTYDLDNQQLSTLSTVNGLSGEAISAIYYSSDFGLLFIGYENGLIDIVSDDDDDVLSVVDILNKPTIPPSEKRINHFLEFNGFVYIATGFGISLFDLENLEFDDSYFIGNAGQSVNVFQTAIYNDFIYAAAGANGLRRAVASNANIIDFNNWITIVPDNAQAALAFNDGIYLGNTANQLKKSTDGTTFTVLFQYGSQIRSLTANNQYLTTTFPNTVITYDTLDLPVATITTVENYATDYATAITIAEDLYLATSGDGVLQLPLQDVLTPLQILPDGPLENNGFAIEATTNEVWMVYGEYNISYNPFPLTSKGISHYVVDEGWTSISRDSIFGATDLVDITINPENSAQVFISSFHSGLLEINENQATTLYNENNSSLQDLAANPGDVRVGGATFGRDGSLYILNSRVSDGIHQQSPGGQFQGIAIDAVLPEFEDVNALDDIVSAPDGKFYIGTSNRGLVGYDSANGSFARISGDEDGAQLPNDDIRALALDRNGILWIGTRRGLRLLFSPASIFTDQNTITRPIVILQDDIPQELLNDQVITDIVVDGANNKWVSTTDSGVFYFSPNGQETLFHFTKDNSPLPVNAVQDISIDAENGTVYFATTAGLLSFNGSVIAPADDLENVIVYPNPVRPGFEGLVTIENLTARTNVKITDIVGNLVYEENTTAGSIQWDTTAFGRHKVASGVYVILITGPEAQETQIAKLMIIR